MARKKTLSLRCPTCRKIVLRKDPEFPFCSERCRLVDLGKWASGAYVVSIPLNQEDGSGDADYTIESQKRIFARPVDKHGKSN